MFIYATEIHQFLKLLKVTETQGCCYTASTIRSNARMPSRMRTLNLTTELTSSTRPASSRIRAGTLPAHVALLAALEAACTRRQHSSPFRALYTQHDSLESLNQKMCYIPRAQATFPSNVRQETDGKTLTSSSRAPATRIRIGTVPAHVTLLVALEAGCAINSEQLVHGRKLHTTMKRVAPDRQKHQPGVNSKHKKTTAVTFVEASQ